MGFFVRLDRLRADVRRWIAGSSEADADISYISLARPIKVFPYREEIDREGDPPPDDAFGALAESFAGYDLSLAALKKERSGLDSGRARHLAPDT